MKIKDAEKYLVSTNLEDIEVNLFRLIEEEEFRKRNVDYRESSIDRALSYGIRFESTTNNIYNMTKRFISVYCPKCGGETEQHGGGGSGTHTTINYHCPKCKEKTISITLEHDAIEVIGNREY